MAYNKLYYSYFIIKKYRKLTQLMQEIQLFVTEIFFLY